MPIQKDLTMLQVDSLKFNIALANAELGPKTLSEKSGVQRNIIYAARKGCYVKPLYLGKMCRILGVKVTDIIKAKGADVCSSTETQYQTQDS